ncbi:acyl-CoA thioesterase [bacterium M00.F.Ca.ET.228.01.1.1]|uniref:acyl-CoA thioesterase n=1 Tax=Paraburkholderia phenoliruptrix TaxID=252970 RepID=UPI001091B337|nr:thioesterase family protein [Paraburkholderia phenoliruptrix]TGP47348.1 acyl-CoA thioesterase [bacterium M00.F.Ca.ET.228.01.1.1]TGS05140.1 acyl-CoA thioesterase [bacterium M00.F.Ca.ET.191.01.1.1]TGU10076.1 acyl-CoA thioesterase [bacterium M00.F.Ca.ET.155.01.1.1]MBW0449657.1 acyl-CoA thioesterase [Paraburkholderia phenoliruptrix]MBW9101275.1 acyl-CoA thioesterase [Paraburkholderia phenoliruptrix]
MTAQFERPVRIRFSHCDPAGIVFFPQYLVMTNALVEDWFNEGLHIDYAQMIGQRRIGLPIVKLDCEFSRPSQMGETVMLTLNVAAIGRRSISLDILGHCNGEPRFRAKQVLVTTSLESGRSIEIPADIASALATFAPQPEFSEAQRS